MGHFVSLGLPGRKRGLSSGKKPHILPVTWPLSLPPEPPKVTLRPDPFSVLPSTRVELSCEVTDYHPQSVSVVWKRHSPGAAHEVLLDTWESGHRQSPNGTYSFTSYARLPPVQPGDQGASYSCHVAHVGLGAAGLQKAVKLHVAGRRRGEYDQVGGNSREAAAGGCPPCTEDARANCIETCDELQGIHAPTQCQG